MLNKKLFETKRSKGKQYKTEHNEEKMVNNNYFSHMQTTTTATTTTEHINKEEPNKVRVTKQQY